MSKQITIKVTPKAKQIIERFADEMGMTNQAAATTLIKAGRHSMSVVDMLVAKRRTLEPPKPKPPTRLAKCRYCGRDIAVSRLEKLAGHIMYTHKVSAEHYCKGSREFYKPEDTWLKSADAKGARLEE